VIKVFNLFACLVRSGNAVGKGALDFLPGHAAAKEIIGADGYGKTSETPRHSMPKW